MFAEVLKTFRKQKGISQKELPTRLHSHRTWKAAAIILVAVAVVSILIVVFFFVPNSDNETTDLTARTQDQSAHLLSVNVKVTGIAGDSGNSFWVEALEDCASTISQGDAILVIADSDEIAGVLEAYQDSNSFRIYFPVIDETSNEISVTCYDVIQYNSAGEIIRQKDGE